ncbi:uracil-DNA glycosylase family protein [Stappia sp. 28M-7]|uniref:uracil-DNA glycosylase n=1 Tax=Stappia sp. 28M-7 TaxID=2762596 RepID=UPI00163C8BC9|nr:uracil-DNA glycosylase [Stappia sp. 28M-7]MBC2858268.1 uracil-DNA glycosylase [Stappia sp. 28M-7]
MDGEGERKVSSALEALLDFYISAGADGWLELDPADAFALSEAPRPSMQAASGRAAPAAMPPAAPAAPARQMPPKSAPPMQPAPAHAPGAPVGGAAVVPGDEVVVAAREAARSAATLDELRDTLARFDGCNLKLTAKSLVFADGPADAKVMFVGEAPGREEDARGLPFVGRSGQLLDRMLEAIGLARGEVYITNVVPWRPPGNRTPSPQETEICKPFILRQIELVQPKVLVFLGGASAKALTGVQDGILRLRGRWLELPLGPAAQGVTIRAMATLHPAYLLRSPVQKRYAWRDFLAIKAALDEASGT